MTVCEGVVSRTVVVFLLLACSNSDVAVFYGSKDVKGFVFPLSPLFLLSSSFLTAFLAYEDAMAINPLLDMESWRLGQGRRLGKGCMHDAALNISGSSITALRMHAKCIPSRSIWGKSKMEEESDAIEWEAQDTYEHNTLAAKAWASSFCLPPSSTSLSVHKALLLHHLLSRLPPLSYLGSARGRLHLLLTSCW